MYGQSLPTTTILACLVLVGTAFPQRRFDGLELVGRVLIEGGSIPGQPVAVEFQCRGGTDAETRTDNEGRFRFQVTRQLLTIEPRSGRLARRNEIDLSGCELRASLSGHTSDSIQLGRVAAVRTWDVGEIYLHPQQRESSELVSVNALSAPPKATKAFDKARKELEKEPPDLSRASRELKKALEAFPEFSDAWYLLGKVRVQQGDLQGAREALMKAAVVDPVSLQPLLTLSLLELKAGRPEAAVNAAVLARERAPDSPEAAFYLGTAYFATGDSVDAEVLLRDVASSPHAAEFPRVYFLLGETLANRGKVQEAAVQYHKYLNIEPHSKAAALVRARLERWRNLGLLNDGLRASN